MIYQTFQDSNVSMLGLGMMRLPIREDGGIDEEQTGKMVQYAIENGLNYFDTAWTYHGGESERITGKLLGTYPRDKYYLASKFPGHVIRDSFDPEAIFEEQLKKCGVEYFDFYLLHNVYEKSVDTYMDPRWGILNYLKEQKRIGRIRHLGFSFHGFPDLLVRFLDYCEGAMEFCQLQLNYLDWTLQNGKEKYEILTERGIPVWVMEPVRGGFLASLPEADEVLLKSRRPSESIAAWGFRFLQELPNVKVILSGMSNMNQLEDNIRTFSGYRSLSGEEIQLLQEIAEKMKSRIPCTGCRYCCDGCPAGLDIPMLLTTCNEIRLAPNPTLSMRLDSLSPEKLPDACIKCGACTEICPQNINIPGIMEELAEAYEKLPKWADICREREEKKK